MGGYWPIGHGLQSFDDQASRFVEYLPAGQRVQKLLPVTSEYEPTSQSEQTPLDAYENFPLGQGSHESENSSMYSGKKYFPAAHATHSLGDVAPA